MESFKIENLSFSYPQREHKALDDINISINKGEFVTICGKSGCGKTTLLRLLKPAISPHGEIFGKIYFENCPLSQIGEREQAQKIGFVMQNPDNQIVTDKVWHELAFGLESLGYKTEEIRMRVSEMASYFGIQGWFHKKVCELSGGQKQILNLASVMAMQPSVLILDEPTAQLDPIAAGDFLRTIEKINRELGVTVIMTEHRLEEVFPVSDRVIVLDEGKITADCKAEELGRIGAENSIYSSLPVPMRVFGAVEKSEKCPLTVRDGRIWLENYAKEHNLCDDFSKKNEEEKNFKTAVEMKDVWFRYEKNSADIVKGLNLTVKEGEIFCIVGGNGAGKSTTLSLLSGINKPYRGKIFINGEKISEIDGLYDGLLGVIPQNPTDLFVKKTVRLDLEDVLSDKGISKEEKAERLENVVKLCGLFGLLESHPYDLSGGEQQRAALAKILLNEPKILVLDEPTKGMDAEFKKEFGAMLKTLKNDGATVVMVSHDTEFCAQYADTCAMFFDGAITSQADAREFFAGKNFYTTAANRMARGILPDAVLAEDIIYACTGKAPDAEKKTADGKIYFEEKRKDEKKEIKKSSRKDKKISKNTLFAMLFVFFSVPLTILFGTYFLEDRKYYFISLLIIAETLIPFFAHFEGRKPKAREIVVISVLCALGVCGRAIFYMLPQFKPLAAIVIVSGACFGGGSGFLVGAVSAFVSNFFFGQGPWTPWQMFSFGIIGFLSGLIFKDLGLKKSKLIFSIYGFLAIFLIYGGIMNPASVIMYQENINMEMIISSYVMGAPFDLIHALSTVFFMWCISEVMCEKLERIKIKYGLTE